MVMIFRVRIREDFFSRTVLSSLRRLTEEEILEETGSRIGGGHKIADMIVKEERKFKPSDLSPY